MFKIFKLYWILLRTYITKVVENHKNTMRHAFFFFFQNTTCFFLRHNLNHLSPYLKLILSQMEGEMQRKGKNINAQERRKSKTSLGLPPKQHLCLVSLTWFNALFFNQYKSNPQRPIVPLLYLETFIERFKSMAIYLEHLEVSKL